MKDIITNSKKYTNKITISNCLGREEGYNNKPIRYHNSIGYSMLKDIVKDKKVEVFRILGNCRKCLKVKILNTWVTIQSIDREVLMKFRGQNKYKE